ncbi:MAG: hypothetical protein HXS46_10060 [Theionarchaea archaeon]|nr:hypothetical protein [Theionarchaea archaeon]
MKAIETELKRLGVAIELEGSEGKFNIQDAGSVHYTWRKCCLLKIYKNG